MRDRVAGFPPFVADYAVMHYSAMFMAALGAIKNIFPVFRAVYVELHVMIAIMAE